MKRLVYLGTLVALLVVGLSVGSLAAAQEDGATIPEPVPGGETPIEGPLEDGATIPEPVPGGETPVDQGDTRIGGTIPTPQPSTPVEGPATGPTDVTKLPDTGGMTGMAWVAGALLLGGGLVVRRIIR
jgi:LPXTG-motif cell wall-anchored protein